MGSRAPIQRLLPSLQPHNAHGSVDSQDVALPAPPLRSGRDSRHPQQRQKRIACKACRQAKLRCDRENPSGHALCSRCRRLSLDCRVDFGYKRVNKRDKLDELAEQVERLRSVVDQNSTTHNAVSVASDDSQTRSVDTSLQTSPRTDFPPQQLSPQSTVEGNRGTSRSSQDGNGHLPAGQQNSHDTFPFAQIGAAKQLDANMGSRPRQPPFDSISSRSLEEIELNSQQISQLFHSFFENYYHFMEILDLSVLPDYYYNRSPLLFWCIISIAARRYDEDATLVANLSPCVTKLMWNTVSVRPHSRYTIQALLLISLWSFPTNTMATDQSFMMVSLAKCAAMQLGLHRPETVQDFLRVKTTFGPQEFQEAVKVWAGCFIVAQSVTASAGQPSTFSHDWAIDQACEIGNKYTLPDNLRCHLLIHKYIARINTVMIESGRSPTGYPPESESCVLMEMLEKDFGDLERSMGHRITEVHSILLSMACVQLRTYYFFMSPGTDVRKQGLLKAYAASINLISKSIDADMKWNFVKFAPNGFVEMLTIAAMVLMKIINSSYAVYVDTEGGKRAFNAVLSQLRKSSVEDNDLQGRVSKIIAQLWGLHRTLNLRREEEPIIHIKTRWGASLLHDSLWMWREEFGGQRAAPSALNASISTPPTYSRSTSTGNTDIRHNPTSHDESWVVSRNISLDQPIEQQNTVGMTLDAPSNLDLITDDLQDTNWIWDIGFPSVMPIDINSYEMLDVGQNLEF